MKNLKKLTSLLLALALMFSMTACGGDEAATDAEADKPATETEAGAETATEGGKVLRLITNIDLNSMDAQITTDGLAFEVITSCTDGLYFMNLEGVPVPALADKTEVSEDGLTYTFTIKDAKWSNGDPVTAHDFEYAWKRLGNPETKSEYNYMLDVAGIKNAKAVINGEAPIDDLGVKAVDDKTLVVELEKKVPFFLSLTAFTTFMPANQKFVESKGEEYGLSADATISNGPFKMVEWNQGTNWKLVKNPDYYDVENVKLDGIDYKVMLDTQSAVLEYEAGNADYVKLTGELVEQYKNHPDYSRELGAYLWYLSVNINKPNLENENLCMALKYAFDRTQIAENVLKDGSIPIYGFVPLKLAADANGKDFRETNGDILTDDKEKAKEYWEKAKKEMGTDTVEIELLFEDSEQSKNVAEFLQADIQNTLPGVTINLKSQPKKTRLKLMDTQEYEMGLTRWGPDYQDPMTYLELFMENGLTNYAKYRNDEYQKLMEECLAAKDAPDVRWQKMLDAEKVLMAAYGGPIPVYQVGDSALWNPKVTGVIPSTVGVKFKYKYADITE